MTSTFTLDEVTTLMTALLGNLRAGGGVEDGTYPLDEVARRCNIAPTRLLKDCRADLIEHVGAGDARSMTPTQVAKALAYYSRGGDLRQLSAGRDDMTQAREASRQAAGRRTPRRVA